MHHKKWLEVEWGDDNDNTGELLLNSNSGANREIENGSWDCKFTKW